MELVVNEANSGLEKKASRNRYGRNFGIAYLVNLLVPHASAIIHAFVIYCFGRLIGVLEHLHLTLSPVYAMYPMLSMYSDVAIYFIGSSLCVYLPCRAVKSNRVTMALLMVLAGSLATVTNVIVAIYAKVFFSTLIDGIAAAMAVFIQIVSAAAICQNSPAPAKLRLPGNTSLKPH